MNIDFNTEVTNLHRHILELIENYRQYILGFVPHTDVVKLAQYILHTKSCNSFISSTVLCMSGLHVESYNATRTGLEHGWLEMPEDEKDEEPEKEEEPEVDVEALEKQLQILAIELEEIA